MEGPPPPASRVPLPALPSSSVPLFTNDQLQQLQLQTQYQLQLYYSMLATAWVQSGANGPPPLPPPTMARPSEAQSAFSNPFLLPVAKLADVGSLPSPSGSDDEDQRRYACTYPGTEGCALACWSFNMGAGLGAT